ncbi:MAG: hypothetical protein J0M24_01615 [Verrucomicrobia bacterium]|nr:hypothetical protein [Verrucomicrobiota bacterium]
MNYYVRRQPSAAVEGPFTAPELANGVQEGRISADCLVSNSRGVTAESLRRYRRSDWSPVREVPGMEELVPAPELGPVGRNRFLRWASFVGLIIGSVGNTLLFVQNPQWRTGLLAVSFSVLSAHEIYQYLLEKGWIRRMAPVKP